MKKLIKLAFALCFIMLIALAVPAVADDPGFSTGVVTLFANGEAHEPWIYHMHSAMRTEGGMMSASGIPFEAWMTQHFDDLPVTPYFGNMYISIDGEHGQIVTHLPEYLTGRDDITFIAVSGAGNVSVPDELGLYMLYVDVRWGEGDEFTLNRYMFKIDRRISDYGRDVATEFLRDKITLYTDVPRAEVELDSTGRILTPTGRFILGWDSETGALITTDEVPEVFLVPTETGIGFFDKYGNEIHDAPWMYTRRGEGWTSLYYAGDIKLFDLDNNGIPEIFVHYNQTFDGGYAGFYRIFRYVDGAYRMLEMQSFTDGMATPWPWLGRVHDFFVDDSGRIVAFIWSEYHNLHKYEELVLTDEYAQLHLITQMDWQADGDAWQAHHWSEWGIPPSGTHHIMLDSWIYHDPVIFGTDIALTRLEPFHALRDAILAVISRELE